MKIRVAIIDNDKRYITKIMAGVSSHYNDKLEVYAYTDVPAFLEGQKSKVADVLLVAEELEDDTPAIEHLPFAYLSSSNSLETLKNKKVVCRYQKIDLLYNEVLGLYSENTSRNIVFRSGNARGSKIMTFISSSGGSGSSTIAAATAIKMARQGKKVLYFNTKTFGSVKPYFSCEGKQTFSDVLFAVKNKKANLALKIASAIKQDPTGVSFFDDCNSPLDLSEMTKEDLSAVIEALLTLGTYDHILVTVESLLEDKTLWLLEKSSAITLVSTGSDISNSKAFSMINVLKVLERRVGSPILSKVGIFHNIFSSKTGKYLDTNDITLIGGSPTIVGATPKQIVEQISHNESLNRLF